MTTYTNYRVAPGTRVTMSNFDPDEKGEIADKKEGQQLLEKELERISVLQERLYAEGRQSLLVIFQATDTGGKDGTIKKVFDSVNPQGCRVVSFKAPTEEESAHDFLWRVHYAAPRHGMVGIFNRSHYEDVLVARVKNLVPPEVWGERYQMINDFERLLAANGTTILKFFLNISRDEQKKRLMERRDDPSKHWKFNMGDLKDRELWDSYQEAFSDILSFCSTPYAPWYVVPANRKWYRNVVVAHIIADTLERMNPQYPPAPEGLESVEIPD